jgi:NAD(P)-dependent dehydrogenase (short-subunit alcohol dehydrogenase family)
VAAADIDVAAAKKTVEIINSAGGSGRAFQVDVADADSVANLAERLEREFHAINVLVNNAGISTPSRRVHEIPVGEWDEVIAINLRGVFLCSRALLPLMLDAEGPSIVNIASIVGVQALDPSIISQAGYAAAKGGVIGLTMQTAADYGEDGVRANAIAPGWHLGTNLGTRVGNFPTPEDQGRLTEILIERTPLRRTSTPEELAPLVLYLASDASAFVTGQVIAHDGGWTTW